ncbi:MAG: GxGYxYP domain-containing protein [Promethearchaeota archaeon]
MKFKFLFIVCLVIFPGFFISCNIDYFIDIKNKNSKRISEFRKSQNPKISSYNSTKINKIYIANFTANYSISIAVQSLQGILNKEKPMLFFIKDEHDKFWCNYIIKKLKPNSTIYYNNFSDLISAFKSNISGIITYNSENLHTRNIAIPFCGKKKAILADSNLAQQLSNKYSIPILENFNFAEKWDKDTGYMEMYEWLFNNYIKKGDFNQRILALQGPNRAELVDLLVRDEIFTLWDINTIESEQKELDFIKEVFDYYPDNSPILGYQYATPENEGKTVRLISEAGLYLVASDFSSNLAFCGHLNFGFDSYKQDRTWEKNPPKLEHKLYICFLVSDGDNLQYLENRMLDIWQQKDETNDIPIGWSISPLALHYAPHIIGFYYSNTTDYDYFVAGPSGAGYIYPDVMKVESYNEFLDLTKNYMESLDLSEIWALGLSDPDKINQMISLTGIDGLFIGYDDKVWNNGYILSSEIPQFYMFRCGIEISELTDAIEKVLLWNSMQLPQFLPIWITCWEQDYEFIKEVVNYCKDNKLQVEFVRPDQFIYLYLQARNHGEGYIGIIIGIIAIIGLLSLSIWQLYKKEKFIVRNDNA